MKGRSADITRTARLLARATNAGALATSRRARRDTGHPYVSKVGVALASDGSPLFLFSTLAAHTQDVLADPRAALLLEAPETSANPLESPRVTLSGRMTRLEPGADQEERARYLAHHPGAARYAAFGDFAMWRLDVDKVHYVGGFGAAKWTKGRDYLIGCSDFSSLLDELAAAKKSQVQHLLAQQTERSARGWKVIAVDGDGLLAEGPKGARARLDFPSPAQDVRGWRARFARMVKKM